MIAAIIPARGGSKRIPGKNIRSFCGKPIIAWSIEAARQSGLFDHIIVSTDDEKIAGVARAHGADTPFMRPAGLSGDMTATMPVVHHAVEWIEAHIGPLDYACCLYATAPLASGDTLRRGFEAMKHANADFAMSVTSFPFPVQRALARSRGRLARCRAVLLGNAGSLWRPPSRPHYPCRSGAPAAPSGPGHRHAGGLDQGRIHVPRDT